MNNPRQLRMAETLLVSARAFYKSGKRRLLVSSLLIAGPLCGAGVLAEVPVDSWLSEAYSIPFKQQLVSGTLDGAPVTLEEASIVPNKRFSQKLLRLVHNGGAADTTQLDLFLPGLASYANKTITFPTELTEPLEPMQVRIRRGTGSKAFSKHKKFCQGRVTFGVPIHGKLPGHVCIRFGDDNIAQSELNGYFYVDSN